MSIEMVCTSAQPTAAQDGATVGGARVLLVERVTSGSPAKGAQLELFLGAENKDAIKLGDVKTVTVK